MGGHLYFRYRENRWENLNRNLPLSDNSIQLPAHLNQIARICKGANTFLNPGRAAVNGPQKGP